MANSCLGLGKVGGCRGNTSIGLECFSARLFYPRRYFNISSSPIPSAPPKLTTSPHRLAWLPQIGLRILIYTQVEIMPLDPTPWNVVENRILFTFCRERRHLDSARRTASSILSQVPPSSWLTMLSWEGSSEILARPPPRALLCRWRNRYCGAVYYEGFRSAF